MFCCFIKVNFCFAGVRTDGDHQNDDGKPAEGDQQSGDDKPTEGDQLSGSGKLLIEFLLVLMCGISVVITIA